MKLRSSPSTVVSLEQLRACPGFPEDEWFARGPVAVIECVEEIPCDPCEAACRFGAIQVGERITARPRLIAAHCRGCRQCISACPGLAIFVVDTMYSDTEACVSMPYEFLPIPEMGRAVVALDREGEPVCEGKVVQVDDRAQKDFCRVVSVVVPKGYAHVVRALRVHGNGERP
jgi:Fe-S-cluster-containing hydrogenase component 2